MIKEYRICKWNAHTANSHTSKMGNFFKESE